MFVDGSGKDRSGDGTESADICIIGGGAAGITLACELADGSHRVILIESGGLNSQTSDRGSYRVSAGQRVTVGLVPSMPSYFGGATNYWYGTNRPLDANDFQLREWIPHSGWPIGRRELDPYYERAQVLSGLGSSTWYDVEACRPHLLHPTLTADHTLLETRIEQTCPVLSFAELHRRRLENASDVRVLLGVRATCFKSERSGSRVVSVETIRRDGSPGRIEADTFVLACGGIENARLLLCSNESDEAGLGNANGLVGRYFMEHPFFDLGLHDWNHGDLTLYESQERGKHEDSLMVGDAAVSGQVVLSEAAMEKHEAPGFAFWVAPSSPGTPSIVGMKSLRRYALRRGGTGRPTKDVQLLLTDPLEVPKYLWRRAFRGETSRPDRYRLQVAIEQTPDPANCVTLSKERDALGQPMATLAFGLKPELLSSHAKSLRLAGDAIGLDGRKLARQMRLMADAGYFGFFWHHMGTTRMSADPLQGVVDADCRVHGVPNLFVAGCSVFPTGGTAPPTLTIVALAARLADRLKTGPPVKD